MRSARGLARALPLPSASPAPLGPPCPPCPAACARGRLVTLARASSIFGRAPDTPDGLRRPPPTAANRDERPREAGRSGRAGAAPARARAAASGDRPAADARFPLAAAPRAAQPQAPPATGDRRPPAARDLPPSGAPRTTHVHARRSHLPPLSPSPACTLAPVVARNRETWRAGAALALDDRGPALDPARGAARYALRPAPVPVAPRARRGGGRPALRVAAVGGRRCRASAFRGTRDAPPFRPVRCASASTAAAWPIASASRPACPPASRSAPSGSAPPPPPPGVSRVVWAGRGSLPPLDRRSGDRPARGVGWPSVD